MESDSPPEVSLELLATIAHDLGNEVGAIFGYAQVLRRRAQRIESPAASWLERGLGHIEDASTRLVLLLDEIVDVARARTGVSLPIERRTTDLAALTTEVALAAHASSGRGVSVVLEAPRLAGLWDAPLIRRVLENLLGNALKYSPDERSILVRVSPDETSAGRWAVLSVEDEGRGVPAADMPHLFQPFRRGSNVAGVEGNGLGLAGVKRIVEAHGGTVAITSVEGRGTTVTVRLPCC